jgi:hypothetical protein
VSSSGRPIVLLFRLADLYCWNAHLVKVGAAFAARQIDFPEFEKLVSIEDTAQRRGSGIWRGYSTEPPPKPPVEPYEFAANHESRPSQPRGFDPSHFSRPARPRYASQASARAQNQEMMSTMIGQLDFGPQLNHTNAGAYVLGGSRVFGSGSHRCGKPTSTTGAPCQRLVANGNACPFHGY